MYTLGRGAVHGGGFGLAVGGVETWLRAGELLRLHAAPGMAELHGAVLDVGVGMLIGMVCAWPLRLRRHGILLHRVAVAIAWAVLAVTLGVPGLELQAGPVIGPMAALAVVPLADWLGFRWRWDPVLLGALVIAAGLAVPALLAH